MAPVSRQPVEVASPASRGEEPCGEQVAGAGRVDDPLDGRRGDLDAVAALHPQRSLGSPRHHQRADFRRKRAERRAEIALAGELSGFVFVEEQEVDAAAAIIPSRLATAGEADAFRQREGDLRTGRTGDFVARSIAARGSSGPHR